MKPPKPKINPLLPALAESVRKRREHLGLSKDELARKSGLHRTYIWGIEKGTANVSLQKLTDLAQALETTAIDLLASGGFASAGTRQSKKATTAPVHVLLIEDHPADVFLIKKAFLEIQSYTKLHLAEDGKDALDFLYQKGDHAQAPRPNLILLDLNLPKVSGKQVLGKIKSDKKLSEIPVVVLTTSDRDEDIIRSYGLHANCFVTKPADAEQFVESIKIIYSFWVSTASLPPQTG